MKNFTYLQIRCEIRTKYKTHPNNSWTQAKSSEIFYAGIEVSKPRRLHYFKGFIAVNSLRITFVRCMHPWKVKVNQWSYICCLTQGILIASHILRDYNIALMRGYIDVLLSGRPRLPCMCFCLRGGVPKRGRNAKENRQAREKQESEQKFPSSFLLMPATQVMCLG